MTTDRKGIEIVRYQRHGGMGYAPYLWHVVDHQCGTLEESIAAVAHVVAVPESMCKFCLPELARKIAQRP